MNIRLVSIVLLAATVLAGAASCSKNEPEEKKQNIELSVGGIKSVQNIVAEKCTLVVNVLSNVGWSIQPGQEEWIHFDVLSGAASESVRVNLNFDANSEEETRRSSFVLKAGTVEEKFTVIQAAYVRPMEPVSMEVTGIDEGKISMPYTGGTASFKVNSNYSWAIDASTLAFGVFDPQQGDAGVETEVMLTVPENKKQEVLSGTFTVQCRGEKLSFAVEQAAAPEPAVINLTGKENNTVNCEAQELDFTVNANYDWTIDASGISWADVSPVTGAAGSDVAVRVSIQANSLEQQRQGSFTITAREAVKTVSFIQTAYTPAPSKFDTHEVGFVFFEDDFAWVASTWDVTYPKFGWVSAKTDGTHNNEYLVSAVAAAKAEADRIGYTYDACCYAKAEGCVKLGKAAQIGSIMTPALSTIDGAATAVLDVSFNAALYCSASKTPDSYQFIQLSIDGDGDISVCGTAGAVIAGDGKSVEIPLSTDADHIWTWTRKHVIVSGATAQTKIKFGSSDTRQGRCFLDDIRISRAVDSGATAAGDAIETPALSYDLFLNSSGDAPATACQVGATLRVNRDFEISSDSNWLTISQIAYATSTTAVNKDGVVIAEDGLSATVTRTGMPYNKTVFLLGANDSPFARTAVLTVTAGGSPVGTISVRQEGSNYNRTTLAKWSWTGLVAGGDLDSMVSDWVSGSHTFNSDAVAGGVFTAFAQGSAAAFSTGTSAQKKDRLRINKMSVGDYFQYVVAGVNAPAGSIIMLSGVGIATTAITTGPVNWTEEYSLNGGANWTTVKTINITSGSKPFDLGCEIPVASALSSADVLIRVRIADNKTSSGTFVDGNSNIGMVMLNADDKVTSNDTHYTDDWAYATIELLTK